jgi:hypothetical protein
LFLGTLVISDEAYAQKRIKYKGGSKYKKSQSRGPKSSGGGSRAGRFRKFHYLGFNVNALNYYGDLAPTSGAASTDVSFTRPGFGLTYGYRVQKSVALRANINYGRLKADDYSSLAKDPENLGRYWRNLSFTNDIIEFTAGMNIYFWEMDHGPSYRHPFNFYIFLGGGVFLSDPKGLVPQYDYQLYGVEPPAGTPLLNDAGKWVSLRPLGTEGQNLAGFKDRKASHKLVNFNIPISIGGMVKIPNQALDIHFEMGYRFVFTDYLDDVSNNYINLDQFTGDNADLARIMSDKSSVPISSTEESREGTFTTVQLAFGDDMYYVNGNIRSNVNDIGIRGSPKSNDMYFVTSLRITYIIPKGNKRVKAGKYR